MSFEGKKPRCLEVHPIYKLRCLRTHGHPGPCMATAWWNEEPDDDE